MPNRGTPQDQQQTGRRNPIQTTPDDEEELEAGDPALMEEAGNLRPRNTQQAAVVGETDIEDEEAEGDEDEDETEGDEEPVGGRV